jgi:hypothetical protein
MKVARLRSSSCTLPEVFVPSKISAKCSEFLKELKFAHSVTTMAGSEP